MTGLLVRGTLEAYQTVCTRSGNVAGRSLGGDPTNLEELVEFLDKSAPRHVTSVEKRCLDGYEAELGRRGCGMDEKAQDCPNPVPSLPF